MFLHLDNLAQADAIAALISFFANNRDERSRISVSDPLLGENSEAFAGVLLVTCDRYARGGGDRVLVAPNGEELHIN